MKILSIWIVSFAILVGTSWADDNTNIVDFWSNSHNDKEILSLLAPFVQTINNAAIAAENNNTDSVRNHQLSSEFLSAFNSPDLGSNISAAIANIGSDKIVEALENGAEEWDQIWITIEEYYPQLAVVGESDVKKYSVGSIIASSSIFGEDAWRRKIEDTTIQMCFWIIACPPPPPPEEDQ